MTYVTQNDPAFDKDLAEAFAVIEGNGKALSKRTKDRVSADLAFHRGGAEAFLRLSLMAKGDEFESRQLIMPFVKRSRLSKAVLFGRMRIMPVLAYLVSATRLSKR